MSHRKNMMHGMMARLLRRCGFVREKGKPIFVKHTIGLGGVYVKIFEDGSCELTVRDAKTTATFTNASKLKKVIGQLNVVDVIETARWRQRISEFNADQ